MYFDRLESNPNTYPAGTEADKHLPHTSIEPDQPAQTTLENPCLCIIGWPTLITPKLVMDSLFQIRQVDKSFEEIQQVKSGIMHL